EVASALAHEQAHVEWEFGEDFSDEYAPGSDDNLLRVSGLRLGEVASDAAVPEKMHVLGMNGLALPDVLKKLSVKNRGDIVHGNWRDRVVAYLGLHNVSDFETGENTRNKNKPIPGEWKQKKAIPSITERLTKKTYGSDFEEAMKSGSADVVREAMADTVRWFGKTNSNRSTLHSELYKALSFIRYYSSKADVYAERYGWKIHERDAAFLAMLMTDEYGLRWSEVCYESGKKPEGPDVELQKEITRSLRVSAVRVLRDLDSSAVFLNSCIKIPGFGEKIGRRAKEGVAGFLEKVLINDTDASFEVAGKAGDVNEQSYLTVYAPYLFKLRSGSWNEDYAGSTFGFIHALQDVIQKYAENYWALREWSREAEKDIELFVAALRSANEHYRSKYNIEPEMLYEVNSSALSGADRFIEKICHLSTGVGLEELKDLLFGAKAAPDMDEFMKIVNNRDEKAFMEFFTSKWASFKEIFEEKINLRDSNKLRDLFLTNKSGKEGSGKNNGASSWMYNMLKNNWHMMKFDDGNWPAISVDHMVQRCLGEEEFKSGRYKRDLEKISMLGEALSVIESLPVDTYRTRIDMIKGLLGTKEVSELFNSEQWPNFWVILRRLGPNYIKKNIMSGGSELAPEFKDELLALPAMGLMRDKLTAYFDKAKNLEQANGIYQFVTMMAFELYYNSDMMAYLGISLGVTPACTNWLLPVKAAYYRYLETNAERMITLAGPAEAIEYYLTLDSAIPSGERKNVVMTAYGKRLVDRLSEKDIKDLLSKLVSRGIWNDEIFDHFLKKKLCTVAQFNYFKDAGNDFFNDKRRSGDMVLAGLIKAEDMLSGFIDTENSAAVFTALMRSGRDDSELRALLFAPWLKASAISGQKLRYKVIRLGNDMKVEGEGTYNFVFFNTLMNRAYGMSSLSKGALMEKLLLSEKGLFSTEAGRRAFVEAVRENLPREDRLSGLLSDILESAVSKVDAKRIYLTIGRSLLPMFLRRPEKSANLDIERVKKLSYEGRINVSDDISGFGKNSFTVDLNEKNDAAMLTRFSNENPGMTALTEARRRIEKMEDSLGGRLEEKLGMEYTAHSKGPEKEALDTGEKTSLDIVLGASQK
ncbi:MAG: hypothetical protein HQL28_06965, partial [Candidatus Omnitrophica bacterium]|nr:hypothetical protein [Candidatus Omnitrophota bacterium]